MCEGSRLHAAAARVAQLRRRHHGRWPARRCWHERRLKAAASLGNASRCCAEGCLRRSRLWMLQPASRYLLLYHAIPVPRVCAARLVFAMLTEAGCSELMLRFSWLEITTTRGAAAVPCPVDPAACLIRP
jgi:hypothetical protein